MPRRRLVAALLFGLLVARARPAGAGPASFETTQFHPTTTGGGYLAVDGAFAVRHLGFTVGLFGSYGHRPLVLRTADGNVPAGGEVIAHQLGMAVVGSFGVIDRLELGVSLPFVAYQQTDNTLAMIPGGIAAAGLGDLRIDVKVMVYALKLRAEQKIGFTLIAGLRVPTGDANSFLGQDGVSGYPRLVAEWRHRRAGVAANVGAVLRSTRTYTDLAVTHQIAYGLAGRVGVGFGLEVLAELTGLVGVGLPAGSPGLSASAAPAEVAAGLRWRAPIGIELSLAGGAGITRGYGTPDGRVIFGIRYESPSLRGRTNDDNDGDGVADKIDACPRQPGPADNRGCPDSDGDADGVADRLDGCPREPGPTANRGCPDKDADGDGVLDRLDRCPADKGDASQNGCPLSDKDNDGVPDGLDRCPDVAGVKENDGCADIDSDGDGLVDRLDKCTFDAEVYNGVTDDDGCPDPGPALAEITEDRIVLKEPILFDRNAVDKRSLKVLDVVTTLLQLHPEITKVRVEGFTDNRGSAIDNLDISRARAGAVRRMLIDLGVSGKRITAQGFGPDRPIADNKTEEGRKKNRRIELVIVERKDSF